MPWLTRALLLNPTASQPHHVVARCLAAGRQPALAQREFRLAAALGDQSALAEASRWFRSLDELLLATPDTPTGRRQLAEAIAIERPADAARVLEELRRDYGDPEVLPFLAQEQLAAGQKAEALDTAMAVLQAHPDDARTALVAHRALRGLGRDDDAWALLERFDRSFPGQPEVVQQLVEPLLARRRFSEARRLVATIVPGTSTEMAAREMLTAHVLLAQGRDEEAAGHLELASASPGARPALEALAGVLEKLGRPDEAVAALQRAAALPGTPPGAYDAGIAAIRSRKSERARAALLPASP
jgi:tetratricopeptide (TPR) repeat protein